MFGDQELNEQNSEYFDQPSNMMDLDEEEEMRPIESNSESYLANIRKG